MSTVKSSWDNPAIVSSDSPTQYPKERPVCYHQFLTRPVKGQLVDFQRLRGAQRRRIPTPREVADISTSSVLDLSFPVLCNKILLSLDHDRHNVALCPCCRGKGKSIENESMRRFVLILCGGFRELSPNKRSWPW
jgi:hypothetical protein